MNGFDELLALPVWALWAIGLLVAVQIGVEIYALVVLFRTPDERLVFGKKWPWIAIILLVNMVGAIAFLAAGRTPAPASDPGIAGDPTASARVAAERASRAADVLYGPQDGDGA